MLALASPSKPPTKPDHASAVRASVALSLSRWRDLKKKGNAKIDLFEILRKLRDKKVPFVLTGALALSGWRGEPRAAPKVEVLVKSGRSHELAVSAIGEIYPQLKVKQLARGASFFIPGEAKSVVDVTYPHRADIEDTLSSTTWVVDQGLRYRIPYLEAALADKYGSMLSTEREPARRRQDALDFAMMVRYSLTDGHTPIDRKRLQALGQKAWPHGGGSAILELVDHVFAGGRVDAMKLAKRTRVRCDYP
jgi:hypothetical protein